MSEERRVASGARISSSGVLGGLDDLLGRVLALVAVVAMSWWYFSVHSQPSADRHHGLTTALGWIGITLSVAAASLSARKRLAYQGPGRLSLWTRAHVYFGLVASFAILYHSSFRTGSVLTTWLLSLFWFTAVSGVLGLFLTRKLPRLLTAMEETPAIIEQLLETREEGMRGLLELASAGSEEFRLLVERRLLPETTSWQRIYGFYRRRSTLAQELPAFLKDHENDASRSKPHEVRAFQRAAEYALRVNKMNAELILQRALRAWLTFHMVATAAMFGLAIVHIVSVLYY